MMTKHVSGSSVFIDITPQTPIEEIKSKLQAATGMHTLIGILVVLDALMGFICTDTGLDCRYSSCGPKDYVVWYQSARARGQEVRTWDAPVNVLRPIFDLRIISRVIDEF